MGDQKQLFLFGQTLPGTEATLLDKIKGCANFRNRNGAIPTKALDGIPAKDILQMVVGHNHVVFLFRNHRVARLSFDIIQNKSDTNAVLEKSSTVANNPSVTSSSSAIATDNALTDAGSAVAPPAQSSATSSGTQSGNNQSSSYAAATAAANRTAKIRRVMMAARRPGGFCSRAGVIVDRARPLVSASSIPEELIAQAQVVLQGKSRDVIVRELQRTNLNVNEAVNNLLSRDDDEGDELDETSEAYLHEELFSLLDAGLRTDGSGSAAIIDHDNIYASAEGYEYLVSRDLARRQAKFKDRGKENSDNAVNLQDHLTYNDTLQYWADAEGNEFPTGVTKFLKIGAMHSELIALADNGCLYSWGWNRKDKPSNVQHPVGSQFFAQETTKDGEESEKIIDFETCAWKAIVLTNFMRIGAFMDVSCGAKISEIFFEPLTELPDGEAVEKLHVSPLFSVIQTTNDRLYWRGAYPYNERRKLFEKARTKLRKHVTFEVNEIVEGSEVRTKSAPVYSAGCVAINFSGGIPMVGTLMESAWTLNETCRFRVQTPEQYDNFGDDTKKDDRKVSFNLSVRKRAAPSDEGSSTPVNSNAGGTSTGTVSASVPTIKETAWSLKDVVFVKEEIVNDIALVKIVDGAYCGIVYKSSLDKQGAETENADISKMGLRLMRKEDLVIVPSSGKTLRAPDNFQRQLTMLHLPSNVRRIISLAVDSLGFRILVEKKNRVHLMRMSCTGKLFSDHIMPISLNTLCKVVKSGRGSKPCLENYGDDGILVLRDACGNLVPLMRNAAGGFREPAYIGLGQMHDLAVGLRFMISPDEVNCPTITSCEQLCAPTSKTYVNKNANRIAIIAALIAPSPESSSPQIPSLMQSILYCDLESVRSVLSKLANLNSEDANKIRRSIIVDARSDGNRNVLHIAVMNAFSVTNKEQADSKQEEPMIKINTSEAETARATFDRKWQEMVGDAGGSPKITKQFSSETTEENKDTITIRSVQGNKERQLNAIEICRELINHSVIRPHFIELMRERDVHGYTPFNAAVQVRAYSAAAILWNAVENFKNEVGQMDNTDPNAASGLDVAELINGNKPDDSPLFVLCYNDTCSFTWTGEEHVNQDIFECKTCGLTGTFCCCTECAYTCHRNHDCKLKRTSPTAYCDCWEKCSCKALVTGNSAKREYLLEQLLHNSSLINNLNARGEHLLLFLAKTVGRQLIEQDNFVRQISKMRSNHQSTTQNPGPTENSIPEHDLDPPKFARRALDIVLGNWSALKSLLEVGLKHPFEDVIVAEDIFHLREQSGSAHLDKFVFTLIARCQESHLDILLNTLIEQANLQGSNRDPMVDKLISRFVRSVIRLFSLITIISPIATGSVLSAISCSVADPNMIGQFSTSTTLFNSPPQNGGGSKTILSNYRAVAISGMLSLVRASLPSSLSTTSGKETKRKYLNAFVFKTRRVFQALVSYSITELLNASDALMAPVRLGMVKPSPFVSTNEVLDVVERYIYSEQDLTTILANSDELQKRKRVNSQHGEESNSGSNTKFFHDPDDSDSDSDSDNDYQSSRRLNSQGSVGGDEIPAAHAHNRTEQAPAKRKNGHSQLRRVISSNRDFGSALYIGDSADSLSSPSEEDDSEDDEDEESSGNEFDDDHKNDRYSQARNRIGHLNVGDGTNDEDDEDEEDRDIDDEEEEDAYFNMDDEEEEVESGGEGDGDDESAVNAGDSNDTAPAGHEEVSVELMDSNDNAGISENAVGTTEQPTEMYIPLDHVSDGNVGSADEPTSSGAIGSNNRFIRHSRMNENSQSSNHGAGGPALNWAVNRVRQESESGTRDATEAQDSARSENRTNAEAEGSTTAATVGSQGTAASSSVPSRLRYRGDGLPVEEVNDVVGHTVYYKEWSKNIPKGFNSLLHVDEQMLPILRQLVNERLKPTWNWLYIVMDRTEAKLKFGNSLASSSIGSSITAVLDSDKARVLDSSKKDQKRYKKRELTRDSKKTNGTVDSDHQSNTHRSELCSYFLSLLRSYSSENGDDLPVIEFNSLKSVAFAVEAYLFHMSLCDELDTEILPRLIADNPEEKMEVEVENKKNLRRFYQRSKSICYSFISTADDHHAFKYSAHDCLPLATRPHLLQSDAERNILFSLPVPHRTRIIHRKVAEVHGILHPTHHGLADPPVCYGEILAGLNADKQDLLDNEMDDSTSSNRPNVIIHSSEALKDKKYQDDVDVNALLGDKTSVSRIALHRCLGRWSNTTLFLSKAFHEQIIAFYGGDASLSVLLNETAGYHIRQSQFRQKMEKLKICQTKDLIFTQMSREKHALLSLTIRQLNQHYTRRLSSSINNVCNSDSSPPPILASHKVKVTFRDEPGEGTGVARSFYSAVAEAFLTMQHLPSDLQLVNEDGSALSDDFGSGSDWNSSSSRRPPSSVSPTRNFFSRLSKSTRQSTDGNVGSGADAGNSESCRIRTRSQRFSTSILPPTNSSSTTPASSSRRAGGKSNKNSDSKASTDKNLTMEQGGNEKIDGKSLEMQPLFYKTSKSGFYTPIVGSNSSTRLNAFRNVGRLIGTCLLQLEILPLFLCRHVFKFILNRQITWFDLAFYDPAMFDSLRSIVYNKENESSHGADFYESLQLTFSVDICLEEGGGVLELKPDGANIPVTKENVLEYIYLFVEHRLLGPHIKCLEAIRRGVFDVLPPDALNHLTAEDLRLILCGNQDISVPLLESYTTFSDESSASPEVLSKYKQWFWSVVSKFTAIEKQDLVFFWTGSPSLPSTEEGFQPLPSIMIRPADDHHLPTANTCISRLYVPLYSSKKIMRSKLLLAIKARNFGFV